MAHFNWFTFLDSRIDHHNLHIAGALLVLAIITTIALVFRAKLKSASERLLPSGKVTLPNILEVTVEWILGLMESIIGPSARLYFPLICGLFIYIFISNLLGIIPGLLPPTENINTNLACSLVVFIYYNVMGIKQQGLKHYLAHFMGPIIWLAPLMIVVELIGHAVRPLSLSLRLFGTITGEHLLLGF